MWSVWRLVVVSVNQSQDKERGDHHLQVRELREKTVGCLAFRWSSDPGGFMLGDLATQALFASGNSEPQENAGNTRCRNHADQCRTAASRHTRQWRDISNDAAGLVKSLQREDAA
jgi:hypothetical protein